MRFVYLDIDSLRPDHLGCYGYPRNTSPHIDSIAARGLSWDRCYASDVPCMPSRTSLFSGQFGIHHGCVSHVGSRAVPFPEVPRTSFVTRGARDSWMQQMRDAGVHTVSFSSFADRHSATHWTSGFSELHDTAGRGHENAGDWMPDALDWLERNAHKPDWFLHLNFWDVHVPYHPPEEFGTPFAEDPCLPEWMTSDLLNEHQDSSGIRSAREALFLKHAATRRDLNPDRMETLEQFQTLMNGYDTSIAYVDLWIGRLLETVERLGIREEIIIVLAADHGECLGELNAYAGHCFADHCTARIPLIMDWPGVTSNRAGEHEQAYCHHLDLAPTVLEGLGAEPPETWDAMSLMPILKGQQTTIRSELVCSQLAQTQQRSVRFATGGRDYLYIRSYRKRGYTFPDHMLFDLGKDPHQTQDLSNVMPDILQQGQQLLHQWTEDMLSGRTNPDPLDILLSEPTEEEWMKQNRTGNE